VAIGFFSFFTHQQAGPPHETAHAIIGLTEKIPWTKIPCSYSSIEVSLKTVGSAWEGGKAQHKTYSPASAGMNRTHQKARFVDFEVEEIKTKIELNR
jgi:hypothetical protein